MIQFLVGALVGGFAAWWWRRDIQSYVEDKLPDVRTKAADRLSALEQRAEEALTRAKHQIDRMRPGTAGGDQSRSGEMASPRSTDSYTKSTGV